MLGFARGNVPAEPGAEVCWCKAAKLAQSMKGFDRRQLEFFEAAAKHLEALFSGKVAPEFLPLP